MQEILLNWTPHESRVALIENAQVQELHLERALERGLLGNIYLGRVTRVLPGMQSAFIDLGLERAAFLHVRNFWQRHEPGEAPCVEAHAALHPQLPAPDPAPRRAASASAEAAEAATARPDTAPIPIEQLIHDGQALMVQVIKDPIGSKGARLSTQISLAGRLLVYLPQDHHIGISQKIAFAMRDALRQRLQQLTEDMAGALFCAPTPKTPVTANCAKTSPISAGYGSAFNTPRARSPRPRCCIKSSHCQSACCAI